MSGSTAGQVGPLSKALHLDLSDAKLPNASLSRHPTYRHGCPAAAAVPTLVVKAMSDPIVSFEPMYADVATRARLNGCALASCAAPSRTLDLLPRASGISRVLNDVILEIFHGGRAGADGACLSRAFCRDDGRVARPRPRGGRRTASRLRNKQHVSTKKTWSSKLMFFAIDAYFSSQAQNCSVACVLRPWVHGRSLRSMHTRQNWPSWCAKRWKLSSTLSRTRIAMTTHAGTSMLSAWCEPSCAGAARAWLAVSAA